MYSYAAPISWLLLSWPVLLVVAGENSPAQDAEAKTSGDVLGLPYLDALDLKADSSTVLFEAGYGVGLTCIYSCARHL